MPNASFLLSILALQCNSMLQFKIPSHNFFLLILLRNVNAKKKRGKNKKKKNKSCGLQTTLDWLGIVCWFGLSLWHVHSSFTYSFQRSLVRYFVRSFVDHRITLTLKLVKVIVINDRDVDFSVVNVLGFRLYYHGH